MYFRSASVNWLWNHVLLWNLWSSQEHFETQRQSFVRIFSWFWEACKADVPERKYSCCTDSMFLYTPCQWPTLNSACSVWCENRVCSSSRCTRGLVVLAAVPSSNCVQVSSVQRSELHVCAWHRISTSVVMQQSSGRWCSTTALCCTMLPCQMVGTNQSP